MKLSPKEQMEKTKIVVDFLKECNGFNLNELCEVFRISKTVPYLLKNEGYLTSAGPGMMIGTDKIKELTPDIYAKLLKAYNEIKYKERMANRKQKMQKKQTIQDFISSRITVNKSKELAEKIFEIIKPYLQ
jgi:hypothetical protein